MPSSPSFHNAAKPGLARAAASTNGVATLVALEATGTDRARIAELVAKKEEREGREGKSRKPGWRMGFPMHVHLSWVACIGVVFARMDIRERRKWKR